MTGADGRFEAKGAGSGTWTLNFEPPADSSYSPVTRQAVVDMGAATDVGDVELGSGAVIAGRVVRMPGNKPASGVRVVLEASGGSPSQNATTDANGAFRFEGLRNGNYDVRLPDNNMSMDVDMLQASETRQILFRLGGATLRGVVIYDGEPTQATLQLTKIDTSDRMERRIETTDGGNYYADNLSAGKWEIVAYGRRGRQSRVSARETVEIPEEGTVEKNIVLPSSRLFGQVVNAEGQPVAGARVTARILQEQADPWANATPYSREDVSERSGDDGSFVLRGLPRGRYEVQAIHDQAGRGGVEAVDVMSEGEVGPLTIQLAQTGNCTLVSVALNMSSRRPLRNAWCMLWRGSQRVEHSARRDENGVMVIGGLDPGVYHVQVSAYGFSVGEHDVTLEPGKETRIEDVLYAAGGVRIYVWDAADKAAAGASCLLQPADSSSVETPRRGQTDASGLWSVRGLMPGEYAVTATLPGGQRISSSVTIEPGQARDFHLRPQR